MDKCPHCGYVEDECEVGGCHEPAEYEGWYRVVDFANVPTGLIQRRRVCGRHGHYLMGWETRQIIEEAEKMMEVLS